MKKHKYIEISKHDRVVTYSKKNFLQCIKCKVYCYKSLNMFNMLLSKPYMPGEILINVREGKMCTYNKALSRLGAYKECLYTDEEFMAKEIIE